MGRNEKGYTWRIEVLNETCEQTSMLDNSCPGGSEKDEDANEKKKEKV